MTARVLVISYAFPPLAAPEAWLSAKAVHSLAHAGVEVEVVCARPRWWHSADASLVAWAHGAAAAVHVVDTPWWLPIAQPVRWLRQFPDPMRLLQRRALRLVETLDVEHFDAVLTWSQWHSAHLVGLALKRRHPRLRWAAHFSDPWVDNPLQPRHRLAAARSRRQEAAVLTAADSLEFTSPLTMHQAVGRVPAAGPRADVIPHAFDLDLYRGEPPRDGPILLRYVGAFYGLRTPGPLFAGLARLQPHPDELRLELVGGVPESMLQATNAILPPGVFSSRAAVPYLRSLEAMREADLLVLVDAPAKENVFVASKLVDYFGARRPIVAITPPGHAAELVRNAGGWVADPDDPDAVSEALAAGIAHVRAHRGEEWGDESVIGQFGARAVGTLRLARLLGANPAAGAPSTLDGP